MEVEVLTVVLVSLAVFGTSLAAFFVVVPLDRLAAFVGADKSNAKQRKCSSRNRREGEEGVAGVAAHQASTRLPDSVSATESARLAQNRQRIHYAGSVLNENRTLVKFHQELPSRARSYSSPHNGSGRASPFQRPLDSTKKSFQGISPRPSAGQFGNCSRSFSHSSAQDPRRNAGDIVAEQSVRGYEIYRRATGALLRK